MAIITLSYFSSFYGYTSTGQGGIQLNAPLYIKVEYDDVNHVIVPGDIIGDYPSQYGEFNTGLGQGVEFYRQNGIGGEYWSVKVKNDIPYAYVEHFDPVALPNDISISSVDIVDALATTPTTLGSLTIHATGSGTLRYSFSGSTNPPQVSNVLTGVPAGTYIVKVSRLEDSITRTTAVTVRIISPVTLGLTKTDTSANGEEDGSIRVNINGGLGPWTIRLYDINLSLVDTISYTEAQFLQGVPIVFNGLGASTYTVKVSNSSPFPDISASIIINEPAASVQIYPGTIFKFPFINSITFVVPDGNLEQGLDNTLLCDQVYEGVRKTNYFQKFNNNDRPNIQFISDYQNNVVQLFDYKTDALIATYQIRTKEDNLNATVEYGITLKADSAGKSRVYFNTPIIPLPFNVQDVFTITDSGEGFNGSYSIQQILLDSSSGFQYLVINKAYGGADVTSLANGIFRNPIMYNVYESTIDFSSLDEGYYYLKVYALSPVRVEARSEPIHIKNKHAGTCVIVYSNNSDAYDIIFSTGYVGMMRIPSLFGNRRFPGGERVMTRNSNFSLNKVSSKKSRIVQWLLFNMPPYMYEKLSVICDLGVYSVNGIPVQSSDGLKEPEYKDRTLLADSSIMLEQLNWFTLYNSDNLMSTISGKDCLCDVIDLSSAGASTPTLSLNMNNKRQRVFKASINIISNKQVVMINASVALAFKFSFFANEGVIIQFPSNFNVLNNNEFNRTTKQWTSAGTGRYIMEMFFDGTSWYGTLLG